MRSKQKHQTDHRHKKGHAPRAIQGHSPTGISRPCTEVLRTRTYSSAANTLLRCRAPRGHLNLFYEFGVVVVFPPCCSSDHCFFWRIRAYDFQRVIRPSLALLRCPVVGPVTLFHAGWVGWSGKNSALNSLIFFSHRCRFCACDIDQ